MDLGLEGKTALMAGSSAGMGRAAAEALAAEGVELVMSARGQERLERAADEIKTSTGARVSTIAADHGTPEGRAALKQACPAPDILVVTCAPPRFNETFRDVEPEELMETLSTTLVGPIELIRGFVDGMADRGFGRIVSIGTGAAKSPAEVRLLSGPARAALCNYMAAVSKRFLAHNVTMNSILPGMFHTDGARAKFEADAAQNGTDYDTEVENFAKRWRIPAKRFGDPEDIGAFTAMLCSRYGSFMSGQSLVIDGGSTNAVF